MLTLDNSNLRYDYCFSVIQYDREPNVLDIKTGRRTHILRYSLIGIPFAFTLLCLYVLGIYDALHKHGHAEDIPPNRAQIIVLILGITLIALLGILIVLFTLSLLFEVLQELYPRHLYIHTEQHFIRHRRFLGRWHTLAFQEIETVELMWKANDEAYMGYICLKKKEGRMLIRILEVFSKPSIEECQIRATLWPIANSLAEILGVDVVVSPNISTWRTLHVIN